jgi:plastocyanin domain-containing protein
MEVPMKVAAGIFTITLFVASGCNSTKAERAVQTEPAETATNTRAGARVTVTVTGQGYEPSSIDAAAGAPLTLVFKRTSDQGCGHEVVFPDRNIRRELPLNEEVEITLTPAADENIGFTCGMGMLRGSIVVAR